MREISSLSVLITGATGGMGDAISRRLAQQGARLALTGRDSAKLQALADDTGAGFAETLEVTDEAQVERAFDRARETLGGIDVLINLPGISTPGQIEQMTTDAYDQVIDVNVKGAFLMCKHFMARVDPERGGQILLTGSMAGKRANANAPVYCAAKAGLGMFAQGLALQGKEKQVRVTLMSPGPTDTDGFWGDRPVPRDKFLRPGDIASVVQFLLALPPTVVVHEIAFEPFEFFRQ